MGWRRPGTQGGRSVWYQYEAGGGSQCDGAHGEPGDGGPSSRGRPAGGLGGGAPGEGGVGGARGRRGTGLRGRDRVEGDVAVHPRRLRARGAPAPSRVVPARFLVGPLRFLGQGGGVGPTRIEGVTHEAQGRPELAAVREAQALVLGQAAVDHLHQRARHLGGPLAQGRRLLVHDLVEDGGGGLRIEGLAPGEKLVEHAARREHVGTAVHLVSECLLGRHVVGGAEHHVGLGQVRPTQPGQAEVDDLHLAVLDVNVRGLEVAMHDPLAVGEGQSGRDLLHRVDLLTEGRELARVDHVAQVLAFEQLHGHVDEALLLAEVVHRHDVGVGEQGRGPSLLLEPLLRFVVAPGGGGHGLDGHEALQDGVPGPVDRSHGPATDLALDLVLPDPLQVHGRRALLSGWLLREEHEARLSPQG